MSKQRNDGRAWYNTVEPCKRHNGKTRMWLVKNVYQFVTVALFSFIKDNRKYVHIKIVPGVFSVE